MRMSSIEPPRHIPAPPPMPKPDPLPRVLAVCNGNDIEGMKRITEEINRWIKYGGGLTVSAECLKLVLFTDTWGRIDLLTSGDEMKHGGEGVEHEG